MNDILKYIKNNLISFDQSCNTILNGYPDETLSARAWRTEQENNTFGKFFRPTIDTLFFFQKDQKKNNGRVNKRKKGLFAIFNGNQI